jgi:glycosyltransferase involved in cell wall biosynthesis
VPVVVTCHDLKTPYLFPKAGFLRGWVVRQLVRSCGAAIVTNVEDLSSAREWSLGIPIHRIPIGSNVPAVPPEGYERKSWRAAHGYAPQDVVWAYFGFLNETKGGETLVEALALSPPAHHLLMIGDRVGSSDPTNRSYAARVEALMDERGVMERVQWTGYLPVDHVPAALLGADIVVLPYRDGASFRRGSLHAALAAGCPVLSTVPRVRVEELVDGKNVCLVPPDDPRALSRAAQDLGQDPELRARLASGARELGRSFAWERITQRTVDEVFRPLVERTSVANRGE